MRKKKEFVAAMLAAALVFAASLGYVLHYLHVSRVQRESFASLGDTLAALETEYEVPAKDPDGDNAQTGTHPRVMALRELQREREHLVGWVMIPGTPIDYPVMQTPGAPEFYLHHAWDGQESAHGTPFAAYNCDLSAPSDNVIVYAHRMNDGSMFGSLLEYESEVFYKEHPLVYFDTLYNTDEYEIFAVFEGHAGNTGPGSFEYYLFTDAETPADFDAYVSSVRAAALYDTGICPEYGDKLLTLSTCTSTAGSDERFVVVARRVEGQHL